MNKTNLFPLLFAAIQTEKNNRLKEFTAGLNAETEIKVLTNDYGFYSDLIPSTSKKKVWANIEDLKVYLLNRKTKAIQKEIENELTHLQTVSNAGDLKSIVVSMEWKKNRTWGANPIAEAAVDTSEGFNRFVSGSISGCGYDKGSTAVAEAVNQSNSFLKAMYLLKENNPEVKNHVLLGYGSGYGILPRLEGGVGVSCYDRIFNKIGFTFKTTASGKSYDVYTITPLILEIS